MPSYDEDLNDAADGSDSMTIVLATQLSSSAASTTGMLIDWAALLSSTAAGTSDGLAAEISVPVSESVAVVASVSTIMAALLTDAIALTAALVHTATQSYPLTDTAAAGESVAIEITVSTSATADWSASLSSIVTALQEVADSAALADALAMTGNYLQSVAATAITGDSIEAGYFVLTSDSAAVTGTPTHVLLAVQAVAAAAALADVVGDLGTMTVLNLETVNVNDVAGVFQALTVALSEGINVALTLETEGDVYDAWVLNTQTAAAYQYSNFNFNSFAEFEGKYYGCAETGIYLLEGDDDAGTAISSSLRTGMTNLGTGLQKRITSAYLGYRSDGQMVLKVVSVNEAGQKIEWWYEQVDQDAPAMRSGRIKVGRGLKSVYWAFEISNKDGADFELDVVELYPMVLERRL